jgi:hypothetical protein
MRRMKEDFVRTEAFRSLGHIGLNSRFNSRPDDTRVQKRQLHDAGLTGSSSWSQRLFLMCAVC